MKKINLIIIKVLPVRIIVIRITTTIQQHQLQQININKINFKIDNQQNCQAIKDQDRNTTKRRLITATNTIASNKPLQNNQEQQNQSIFQPKTTKFTITTIIPTMI